MTCNRYYAYNESFDNYHEAAMNLEACHLFVKQRNQEKGGHYVMHGVHEYNNWLAKRAKGTAYVALVKLKTCPTPLKYRFKHFEMPTYTLLHAWGVIFNEAEGDTISVWSIDHELWNALSDFTWVRNNG